MDKGVPKVKSNPVKMAHCMEHGILNSGNGTECELETGNNKDRNRRLTRKDLAGNGTYPSSPNSTFSTLYALSYSCTGFHNKSFTKS
jgi:hypothetical protein